MKIGSLRTVLAAGVVLALGALATPAGAQRSDDMRGGGGNPCVGDAQKMCNEFIPDRGKVASCLFKNKAKLTPACRAELAADRQRPPSQRAPRHAKRSRAAGRFCIFEEYRAQ